jgi:hypothetical protein
VLRTYLRHRSNLVAGCGVQVQHMQRSLDQMNIHLHHVVSDLDGDTGLECARSVISDAQYRQLRAKLADNRNRKGGNPVSDYIANLFRNRCKCAKCGATIKTSHTVYSCKGLRTSECDVHGTVNIRALEMDFFMLFLQEHPTALLVKQAVKRNGTMATLKARICELDKALSDATDLIGKLPIKALETKLTALTKQRNRPARSWNRRA